MAAAAAVEASSSSCCWPSGPFIWFDYTKVQRMNKEFDTGTLASTEELTEFMEENDLKIKTDDGEWKSRHGLQTGLC